MKLDVTFSELKSTTIKVGFDPSTSSMPTNFGNSVNVNQYYMLPHIGDNGNWFVGENDTGVEARGPNGPAPYIGNNGHWFVADVDTGVRASAQDGKDGTQFKPGNALELVDGILGVKTTDIAEKDNTLPITSSGVNTIVGNIGAILDTI